MKKWTTSHTGNMLHHHCHNCQWCQSIYPHNWIYLPSHQKRFLISCFDKSQHLKTISPALISICLCFLWEVTITALINKDNSHWHWLWDEQEYPQKSSLLPTPIFTSLWQTRADVTFAEFLFLQSSFIEWGKFPDRSKLFFFLSQSNEITN